MDFPPIAPPTIDLPRTRALLPQVEWRKSVGSTNQELRSLVERARAGTSEALPFGSLLATSEQTEGRGRAGRGWEMPPGTALACSFYLRVPRGQGALSPSWLPLLTGSAVTAALQPLFGYGSGLRVGTKWPNDVHVRDEDEAIKGSPGRKLCGILCELLSPEEVIIGAGINLLIPEDQLPTERATSLLAAGADFSASADPTEGSAHASGPEPGVIGSLATPEGARIADHVISELASELLAILALAEARPESARTRVLRHSLTLGTEVRAHLPGGEVVDGFARGLADDGSLIIDLPTGGDLTVSAGDVEHLR